MSQREEGMKDGGGKMELCKQEASKSKEKDRQVNRERGKD